MNELLIKDTEDLLKFNNSDNILNDIENIIEKSQNLAYKSINITLLIRNWLIGKRIYDEELKDLKRNETYGLNIIISLSKELLKKYGSGFNKTNLYSFYSFFKTYPDIFHAVSGKSFGNFLSWTHYRILIQEQNKKARDWYEQEAKKEMWSTRILQRNISSQYYYRMLDVKDAKENTDESIYEYNKLEFIKNPVIAEFLGFKNIDNHSETQLEGAIIDNLQKFIMELGKGYAFVARQQHIHTEKEDYYIDLVFYNYILKCFVLIDLKTNKITHQDVGQMDMYIRMYDELKKSKDDNPTLGIVLCSDTDEDIAKYSILNGNEKLFASKYKLYLPTEEELKREIQIQKDLFYLQMNSTNSDIDI